MDSLVDRINAREKAREVSKAWFVELQTIKKNLGPQLWASLLAVLDDRSESVNSGSAVMIVKERISDKEAKLKNASSGQWLRLRYDASTPCLWFSSSDGASDYYALEVDESGTSVKFFNHRRNLPMFPDELADVFMEMLTKTVR